MLFCLSPQQHKSVNLTRMEALAALLVVEVSTKREGKEEEEVEAWLD